MLAGRPPSSLVLRHGGLLLGWGLVRNLIFSFPCPKTMLRHIIVEKKQDFPVIGWASKFNQCGKYKFFTTLYWLAKILSCNTVWSIPVRSSFLPGSAGLNCKLQLRASCGGDSPLPLSSSCRVDSPLSLSSSRGVHTCNKIVKKFFPAHTPSNKHVIQCYKSLFNK